MSWSVLSAGVALFGVAGSGEQLNAQERASWSKLEPSVAYLMRGGRPVGVAALIDERGLYLAHRTAVGSNVVTAHLADGREIVMELRGSDSVTQLALLQASEWPEDAHPLKALASMPAPGSKLLAALPTGPIRADYSAGKRVGMLAGSRRLLPLSEIRFAAPESRVGGSLVLTPDGQVVGFLHATLGADETPKNAAAGRAAQDSTGVAAKAMMELAPAPQYGPSEMTVAYTLGPALMRRVIEDFRSATGQVSHPSIGVLARDAPDGDGALLQTVEAGGSAHEAGLKTGDVVIELAGKRIRNQLDLGLVVMEQQVGQSLIVRLRRGRSRLSLPIRVGAQKSAQVGNPESSTAE